MAAETSLFCQINPLARCLRSDFPGGHGRAGWADSVSVMVCVVKKAASRNTAELIRRIRGRLAELNRFEED